MSYTDYKTKQGKKCERWRNIGTLVLPKLKEKTFCKKKKIKILPPTGYRGEASCYVLLLLQTKLFRCGEGGGLIERGFVTN